MPLNYLKKKKRQEYYNLHLTFDVIDYW